MATINSVDEAAAWAHRNLPAKNTLTAADAKIVEEQFRARLSAIDASHGTCDRPAEGYEPPHAVAEQIGVSSASERLPARIHQWGPPKSNLAAMQSVLWEKRFACAIRIIGNSCCDRRASCAAACRRIPHHLTFTQPRALRRRVSDEFIVPVCQVHHRELHRSGNEAAWWRRLNIDPTPIALKLWQQTRTDGDQSDPKLWKNARLDEGRTDSKPASQGAAGDGASETPA